MVKTSLLTIVKGRRQHLENLLRGVATQTQAPDEVIVVHMNEDAPDDLPDPGSPLHQHAITHAGDNLPIAKARNYAAEMAKGDILVFLDVDCIPAPTYVADMVTAIKKTGALVMGNAFYLPQNSLREDWDLASLERQGMDHPRRPKVPTGGIVSTQEYHLFWSLCFGVYRETFERIGGFDESYRGYSGEDTDLAFAARAKEIPFYLADARVYHQHHATCSPPFNHLEDIVNNATAFYRKWGTWPMEGWLKAFQTAGYIHWTDEELDVLRLPTEEVINAHRSTDPFA